MKVITAICKEIIFKNSENGYVVGVFSLLELETAVEPEDDFTLVSNANTLAGNLESFTAVGIMTTVEIYDSIVLYGEWVTHPSYGFQFKVDNYKPILPKTVKGILTYLSSGGITGIGAKLAIKILEEFKEDTIDIMTNNPALLTKIRGISFKKAQVIQEQMMEKQELHDISIFLSELGIGNKKIATIYQKYGFETIKIIKQNPYILADEVVGIGFRTADRLALNLGFDLFSVFRISSAIIYCLNQGENQGHTYLPFLDLKKETMNILSVENHQTTESRSICQVHDFVQEQEEDFFGASPDPREIETSIPLWEDNYSVSFFQLLEKKKIVAYDFGLEKNFHLVDKTNYTPKSRVSITRTFRSEAQIAQVLANRMVDFKCDAKLKNIDFKKIAEEKGLDISEEQRQALLLAAQSSVAIITGGPGTGKTTIIKILTLGLKSLGKEVVLCAPTGRAAKRITETSGMPASTIHRLLELERGEPNSNHVVFRKNQSDPINSDFIIVDEASMLDIFLFRYLLLALKMQTQLIIVGDSNQLPSVGSGNVLANLIDSKVIPFFPLTTIYRQAAESPIILNAHNILKGEKMIFNQSFHSACMLIHKENAGDIAEAVEKLYSKILPQTYDVDTVKDVVVLSPSRKGVAGVITLNQKIQKALGHDQYAYLEINGVYFYLEDRVMQTKNNYDLIFKNKDGSEGTGIFNGELGFIVDIIGDKKILKVAMDDGRTVFYQGGALDDLEPAFALTIHKSQGSEYPIVILALPPGYGFLNNRNLLYTAITRAKSRLFVVSSPATINKIIENVATQQRLSSLDLFISNYLE